MRYARYDDDARGVIHRVHDTVIAYADPKVVATGELHAADRARIRRQAVDRSSYSFAHGSLEPSVLPSRRRNEAHVVLRLTRLAYSRTSTHGTAVS